MLTQSTKLFTAAQAKIPGGVNSPVRAFGAVGGQPRFYVRGEGPRVWDADGQRYLDYVGSWGAAVVGHAHPAVRAAVHAAVDRGLGFGAPHPDELALAECLCAHVPGLEQVRLVSSGTEACMSAIRLARGATGRALVVKFAGCYHGHSDGLLSQAGSGLATFDVPDSAGIPAPVASQTVTVPFNDLAPVQAIFSEMGEQIAAVIVEPVAGNMGCILPKPEFLPGLRTLCDAAGALLIFDEVMTGFRVDLAGAGAHFGVKPDLVTLGKVIGGGLPLAAFGGRTEVMAQLAPLGPVYQAGTLSGNPVAVAAGLATLALVAEPGFYAQLASRTAQLVDGLTALFAKQGIPFSTTHIGGMFGLFFADTPPTCFAEAKAIDSAPFKQFFHHALQAGVAFAPSPYEAGFVSGAHQTADIAETLYCLSL